MPVGVDEFISATDKDFSATTAYLSAFPIRFDFTDVSSVNDDGAAVYLHLGLRKLEPHHFPATVGKASGVSKDRRPIRPLNRTIIDGGPLFRNQLLQCGPIIGEIGLPN